MSILQNAETWISSINPPHPNYGTDAQSDIQSVHHSVLDFALIRDAGGDIINQWRGYRYWLGMTTIIPENPWIYASNDNSAWVNIGQFDDVSFFEDVDGILGPVAEDAELVYDPTNDQIVLYWVRTDETLNPALSGTVIPGPGVMRRTYSNAGVFSTPTCVIPATDDYLYANSPAVVRTAADSWHMFGVVQDYLYYPGVTTPRANFQRITYHFSTDGITWGATQYLGTVAEFTTAYPGYEPNHVTAVLNPEVSGQVDLLINAGVTPRPNRWLDGHVLVHAVVNLSDPTAIGYPLAPAQILARDTASWDRVGIYRSGFTLTAADNGDGTSDVTMRLWYSGIAFTDEGVNESCRCGYTEGVVYTLDGTTIVPIGSSGSFSLPSVSLQPVVSAPTLAGFIPASFTMPSLQVQPVIIPPTLAALSASGHSIRSPSGELLDIRTIDGVPIQIGTL